MTARPALRGGSLRVPPVSDADRRSAALALIGRGLDLAPGNPWGMAGDVVDALGLTPPETPARPSKSWRDAHKPGVTGRTGGDQ